LETAKARQAAAAATAKATTCHGIMLINKSYTSQFLILKSNL
jgi:hypothetical protein